MGASVRSTRLSLRNQFPFVWALVGKAVPRLVEEAAPL
jgi:hypothetical protein